MLSTSAVASHAFASLLLRQCKSSSSCAFPGGDVKKLDFRFFAGNKKIGAPFHGLKAFFTTGQLNLLDKVGQLPSPLFQRLTHLETSPDSLLPLLTTDHTSCTLDMLLALCHMCTVKLFPSVLLSGYILLLITMSSCHCVITASPAVWAVFGSMPRLQWFLPHAHLCTGHQQE